MIGQCTVIQTKFKKTYLYLCSFNQTVEKNAILLQKKQQQKNTLLKLEIYPYVLYIKLKKVQITKIIYNILYIHLAFEYYL